MEVQEPEPERLGPSSAPASQGRHPRGWSQGQSWATPKESTPSSNTLTPMEHLNGTPVSQATRGPRSSTLQHVRASQAPGPARVPMSRGRC